MTFDELLSKPIRSEENFKAYVKALYDEWQGYKERGVFPTADRLDKYMEGLERGLPPQFFSGKLDSPVVLLALNPHAGGKDSAREVPHEPFYASFREYWDYWQNFTHERYAKDGKVAAYYRGKGELPPDSKFDNKLLCFLSALAGKNEGESRLEDVGTLGLEFIPLCSRNFELSRMDGYISLYVRRVLDVLFLHRRTLVIILNGRLCGALESMEAPGGGMKMLDRQRLLRIKKDGTPAVRGSWVMRYELSREDGKELSIVAAPTFADRYLNGAALEDYAQKIARTVLTDTEKQALRGVLAKKNTN